MSSPLDLDEPFLRLGRGTFDLAKLDFASSNHKSVFHRIHLLMQRYSASRHPHSMWRRCNSWSEGSRGKQRNQLTLQERQIDQLVWSFWQSRQDKLPRRSRYLRLVFLTCSPNPGSGPGRG